MTEQQNSKRGLFTRRCGMLKRWTVWGSLLMVFVFIVSMKERSARANDWPQWRGVHRDAISAETGLLPDWPQEGPPLVWKAEGLGRGYSSVSVVAGKVFTMGDQNGEEKIIAIEAESGNQLWATKVSAADGDGPRCTPTVDGDRVYGLGRSGDLVCLKAADGSEVWRVNLEKDFGGRMMSGWHYSESPLVDGEKLICTPGGQQATLIALNKRTGKMIWKARVPGGDGAAYSSAIAAQVDGQKEFIQFLGKGVVGVAAEDGKFLWRYDKPANGTANCSTPIFHDHYVFASSAYRRGSGLLEVRHQGTGIKTKEVFFNKDVKNHHGGLVLLDGYVYGAHGGNEDRDPALVCLEFQTGKVMWQSTKAGKGAIAYADGRLYYRNQDGPMLLVEADPKKYVERGRFDQPNRSGANAWAHPVIANGKLYLRDQDVLLCYDIKKK
jgi:outer membrane protein assembly factor BamB